MKRLLFALVMLVSVAVEAQVQRYDLPVVREKLLAIKDGLPAQLLTVRGEPTAQTREFVEHYKNVIHPKMENMLRLYQRRSALSVLTDTGSFISEAEHKQWKKEYNELTELISATMVDPVWAADVVRWGQLAEGLSGELAQYARSFAKELELEHFPEEMRGLLTEVDLLHQEYKAAIIQAPSAAGLRQFNTRAVEIPRQFKTGEITFSEARDQLNELFATVGNRYVGYEAAQAKGDALNRMAVLRTQLAQSKGFRTWAEYQLEASGQGYTPEYRGTVNQREFLHKWIALLKPIQKKYIDQRLREMGLEDQRDSLRRQHLSLLTLPDLSLLQPYFPADKLTDIWEETMLESGFSREVLQQIVVDDKIREGKNPTMAYMAGVLTPESEERVLDARTLNFDQPARWRQGLMYIMQSYRGAGVRDLRTAFHEGMGHALEYLLKEKEELTGEGYGYVEVPSMTAEYFLRDVEYLFAKAIPVNGVKPSVEQIQEWVLNSEKTAAVDLINYGVSALLDLDLWDYDYTQPGALNYLQRLEQVTADIDARAGSLPSVQSHVPHFYGHISTTHFTSGNVRNIGYSYAYIGSRLMSQFISEELKRQTGRASWYQQPGLAELISEKFYKVGWRLPFPLNIEKITGRQFDMEKVLGELTRILSADCQGSLR